MPMPQLWGVRQPSEFFWADIFPYWRVVLLAEALSGKSTEFRYQADKLVDDGKAAFYVRFEELADDGFEQALDRETIVRFEQWLDDTDEGWFFLDSVDEARLNRKNFETALKRYARELGDALERAHIFISCRGSDWKGEEDIAVMHRTLPIIDPTTPAKMAVDDTELLLEPIFNKEKKQESSSEQEATYKNFLVLRFSALSASQCQLLAEASKVNDVDSFMDDLVRNGLNNLAERPGDLLELISYWRKHGRFGSLSQMVEHSIREKLKETDIYRPDNDVLSLEKAFAGAEKLAASLTFGKTFSLSTSSISARQDADADVLDPSDILSDWTDSERATLLRRGIFAPSTYGKVRFHQRTTQEYLAAKWLDRLLKNGCPQQEVWKCIFTEKYEIKTVILSLRPEAAWLSLWQPEIREEVIKREPEILIQHGDPASLPFDVRRRLLTAYAAKHALAEISDNHTDRRALWLFADPELADAIREAWQTNSRQDFKWTLLCLIREGKVTSCVDLARSVALDDDAEDYDRIIALEVLKDCHDHDGLRLAAESLLATYKATHVRVISRFATGLFPKYLDVQQLLTLIVHSSSKRRSDGFGIQLQELYEACTDTSMRIALLTGLADLCLAPPYVSTIHNVSEEYKELTDGLESLAIREIQLFGCQDPPDHLVRLLMVVERAEHHTDIFTNHTPSLASLIQQNWRVKRALFWANVREQRQSNPDLPLNRQLWRVNVYADRFWQLWEDDVSWLQNDLAQCEMSEDRQVVLYALLWIYDATGRLSAETTHLKQSVQGDETLNQCINEYLSAVSARVSVLEEQRRLQQEAAEHRQKRALAQEQAKQSWVDLREQLRNDPEQLNRPDDSGFTALLNLTEWLSKQTNKWAHEAAQSWHFLEPVFGVDVTNAYREGMKALWRRTEPSHPTQNPNGNSSFTWEVMLSVGGIALEVRENPDWAYKLSSDEAHRATCHCLFYGHGFLDWMNDLLASHSNVTVPLVYDTVKQEWDFSDKHYPELLASFSSYTYSIGQILQDILFSMITGDEPVDTNKLQHGVQTVKKMDLNKEHKQQLIDLATTRLCGHLDNTNDEYSLKYLAMLLLLDIDSSAHYLAKWLENAPAEQQKRRAEHGIAFLFERHDPLLGDSLATASVATLEYLIRLLYQYIRPQDDNIHDDAYSPNTRDNAETARSGIFHILLERPGAEAFYTLKKLADDSSLGHTTLRWRELAKKKAENDAEPPAWSANDINRLEQAYTAPVKTGDDLFRLVLSVLADIEFDLIHSDASSRAVLQRAENEEEVQQWLAEQLRLRARNRYHVHREAEVAQRNEPDIIVSSTEGKLEIAIEIKHANMKWTYSDLKNTLRVQLVEKYLKPISRRHGILVISCHKLRRWKNPETKKINVQFDELISRLDAIAKGLVRNENGTVKARCIGLSVV